MASAQSASLRFAPSFLKPPTPPAPPAVPAFSPVPTPGLPAPLPGGQQRINAGAEQNVIDQFGKLDDKYKFDRIQESADLKAALTGLNYKFTDNPDGTVKAEATNKLGTVQRQEVQGQKNQGAARGTLYSSFTDQAIGDALTRINTAAANAIRQYGSRIKHINDNYIGEANSLSSRLSELVTDDARFALESFVPPALPEPSPSRHWVGTVKPNLQTLADRWGIPADQLRITRSGPRSGNKYVVTVKK